jgi:hypothetical protein
MKHLLAFILIFNCIFPAQAAPTGGGNRGKGARPPKTSVKAPKTSTAAPKSTVKATAMELPDCWESLTGSTPDYWARYKCNSCGSFASTAPNAKDEVICQCGVHHTNEIFLDLENREIDGVIQVNNPVWKKQSEMKLKNFKVVCPDGSCGVSNFFTDRELHVRQECATCGTSLEGAYRLVFTVDKNKRPIGSHLFAVPPFLGVRLDAAREDGEEVNRVKGEIIRKMVDGTGMTVEEAESTLLESAANFVRFVGTVEGREEQSEPLANVMTHVARTGEMPKQAVEDLRRDNGQATASEQPQVRTEAEPEVKVVTKKNKLIPEWMRQHRKLILGAIAATGLTAAGASAFLYGNSPVVYEGEVVRVYDTATGGQEVTAEYGDQNTYQITFETNAEALNKYRKGDEVWIHGHKWFPGRNVMTGDGQPYQGDREHIHSRGR